MSGLELVISAATAAASARASYVEGKQAELKAESEAKLIREKENQVLAASQRTALDEARKAELIASRAIAVAAAGGGTATEPGTARIVADIYGEGGYRQAIALYEGKSQAHDLEEQAKARIYAGKQEKAKYMNKMYANILKASAYGYKHLDKKYGSLFDTLAQDPGLLG